MAQLLDQNGNPLVIAAVAEPQTSKIALLQNRFIESSLSKLTPDRAARIRADADQGNIMALHELFDDMMTDAHIACEFGKRKGAISGLDWEIVAPRDADKREEENREWVEGILREVVDNFEDVLEALMDATGHGFAGVEMEWVRQNGEYLPRFYARPQSWFQMTQDRARLTLMDGSADGAALTPGGWILHQPGLPKTGYLARMGLAQGLIWPFIYKHYALGDFAEFLECYGLPIILGKYYQNASEAEKSSLMRAVTQLGHDARAIMPKEMELEIEKVTGAGDGEPHLKMIDWSERSASKLILGQVLSSEAKATGMGSGVADLHDAVRRDILKSDARKLAATLTRDLVFPLLVFNGRITAADRCPRFVFDLGESEDFKLYAETLPILAAGGAKISVAWVHEKLRIPMAAEDEELFGQVAPAGEEFVVGLNGRGAARRAPTSPAPIVALKSEPPATIAAQDGIDALVAAETEDWQPLLDPMLAPLQAALDEAAANNETAAEFIARLPALLEKMDATGLADKLTHAAFIARLAGLANQPLDQD
ncbi:Mu-like prophage FluMu protein gp29 [Betaproteobacteria bacterium]|nr:Mu-like prophage FluMu protein gp29 [Betaproteobacteria bacterium]GHU45822.1 Mu-like prophage FluMu protein gp29 [Betaproteobacteria bacterium]